jgi:hypothetical protein
MSALLRTAEAQLSARSASFASLSQCPRHVRFNPNTGRIDAARRTAETGHERKSLCDTGGSKSHHGKFWRRSWAIRRK